MKLQVNCWRSRANLEITKLTNLEETIRSLHPPKSGALSQATATVQELNQELAATPGQTSGHAPHDPNGAARPSRPLPVQVTAPPSNLIQDLRALLGPVAGPLETTGIVVIFTAFLLIKREDLRNRLIGLGGQGQLTDVILLWTVNTESAHVNISLASGA